MKKTDLLIIGAGPAGCSAAIYAVRAGLKTVIAGGAMPGGQLLQTSEIENYAGFIDPVGGFDLMERMHKQCKRLGVEFTAEEIATLYTKRWDIECSFKTLKTDYEWERYFSKECDAETCALLAKVIFHNITGVLRKELNEHLGENNDETNKYKYCVNIVELSKLLRKGNIIKYIRNNNKNKIISLLETIKDLINKTKVPIRQNRHCKRWGRHLTSAAPFRYRIDGRNNPNSVYINRHLQTIKPI